MKNATINIKGRSGKTYTFHTYKLPTKLTAVGGVIIYLRLLKNSDFKVLKISTSHDLEMELNSSSKIKNYGATHITAIQKNAKSKREQILNDIKYLTKK